MGLRKRERVWGRAPPPADYGLGSGLGYRPLTNKLQHFVVGGWRREKTGRQRYRGSEREKENWWGVGRPTVVVVGDFRSRWEVCAVVRAVGRGMPVGNRAGGGWRRGGSPLVTNLVSIFFLNFS